MVLLKLEPSVEVSVKTYFNKFLLYYSTVKTYFNKYNELFVLCNSEEDLDAIFSETCISKLCTVGCKPVLPPDLKAKRYVILRRCDYQMLNKKEEDIKSEIEKQNACIRERDIFKYENSKSIKVTFEKKLMVPQVSPRVSYYLMSLIQYTSASKFLLIF